jgi:N,N-dimethylformamidase beta subunit-like protein
MFPDPSAEASLSRRGLLKEVAAAGMASALTPFAKVAAAPAQRQRDLIRTENEKPGTTDWQLTDTRIDPATKFRCPWIEGYCSRTSLHAGETLAVHVSTNPPSPFVIDLYRLGYYSGKGGRHLRRLGPFRGQKQPDPAVGKERLRECTWEPAVQLVIPKDWPSGVYVGKLTAEKEKLQSYVIFIVRDDRPCDFLFQ